jgi:hypothetical protein
MSGTGHCLTMDKALFTTLIDELARRGHGERESGAFLLAQAGHGQDESTWQQVIAVAYYDDLDPACLTGGITFSADGYTALSALCRRDGVRAVADIHTHPGGQVSQSTIDGAHPMTALPGHIALIAPRYAHDTTDASDLGAHVFQGAGNWTSRYGRDVTEILQLTTPPAPAAGRPVRALLRRLHRLLTPWGSR